MGCDKLKLLKLENNDISKIDNAAFYNTGSTTKPCQLIETFEKENVYSTKDKRI